MPLTDIAIRKAKPYKLSDGGGLYLEISPSGGKWQRWKYRRPITGKKNRLSFGTCPDVSFAIAHGAPDEARKLLAAGVDPGEQRKVASVERSANSFRRLQRKC